MTATNISEAAVAWARKRGISRETLDRFGAGSGMAYFPGSEHQGKLEAIFFPYSRHGAVVNWRARALASKDFAQKSGGERRFFNLDAVLAGPMEVVFITEGEPEALALSEAGLAQHEILSVPNGAPDKPIENPEQPAKYQYVIEGLKEGLVRCKRFVLATDADEAGRALRQDLVHLLGPARCQFVDWPAGLKDANAMLERDGAQGLGEFIGEAPKDWPVEGLYGLHDLPEPPALTLWRPGFPEWESRIAFAPTTLSIATGEPGHGKTTLMSQVWPAPFRGLDEECLDASERADLRHSFARIMLDYGERRPAGEVDVASFRAEMAEQDAKLLELLGGPDTPELALADDAMVRRWETTTTKEQRDAAIRRRWPDRPSFDELMAEYEATRLAQLAAAAQQAATPQGSAA